MPNFLVEILAVILTFYFNMAASCRKASDWFSKITHRCFYVSELEYMETIDGFFLWEECPKCHRKRNQETIPRIEYLRKEGREAEWEGKIITTIAPVRDKKDKRLNLKVKVPVPPRPYDKPPDQ